MANLSKTTRNHEEIRNWAEERGGKPAHVKGTGSREDIGILRIEFPGYGGSEENLEAISWSEFFEKFDERGLSLIFQEETAEGARSNFNKLVSAETAAESERKPARRRAGRASSKKAGAKKAAKRRSTGSKKAKTPVKSAGKRRGAKKAAAKTSARALGRKKSSPARKSSSRKRR